jgi:hypothetical protein
MPAASAITNCRLHATMAHNEFRWEMCSFQTCSKIMRGRSYGEMSILGKGIPSLVVFQRLCRAGSHQMWFPFCVLPHRGLWKQPPVLPDPSRIHSATLVGCGQSKCSFPTTSSPDLCTVCQYACNTAYTTNPCALAQWSLNGWWSWTAGGSGSYKLIIHRILYNIIRSRGYVHSLQHWSGHLMIVVNWSTRSSFVELFIRCEARWRSWYQHDTNQNKDNAWLVWFPHTDRPVPRCWCV